MAKLLLLLFCKLVFIIEILKAEIVGYYAIPEPNIEAFERSGIRVSIRDDPGISMFRFHANINEDMKQLYPGTVNIETATQVNGKWILEDKHVELRVGDVIYYWLFVEKDRLGYVKQPVKFRIKELVPYYNEDNNNVIFTRATTPAPRRTTTTALVPEPTTPSISTPCPIPSSNSITLVSLQNQIDALNKKIDLITSISALQTQVDTLTKKFGEVSNTAGLQSEVRNISKTVDMLSTTLEHLPDIRKLTLSGTLPPDQGSNPDHVVRFVIWEKLDMRVNVVSAVRTKDGSIVFELKTLQEKFDLLQAAQEKLKGTRITIT